MEPKEQIRQFIAHNFYVTEPSQLDDDASLIETGVIDSTGVLEVVAFLEQAFGLVVSDEDIVPANLDSVDRMAAYVVRKRPKPVAAPATSLGMLAPPPPSHGDGRAPRLLGKPQ